MSLLNSVNSEIAEKIAAVRERIAEAAKRSGRTAGDVALVAVSKYASPDDGVVAGFLNAGAFDLAENRPQKLLEKTAFWNAQPHWDADGAPDYVPPRDRADGDRRIRWHFIGALQRNKVRRVLPFVSLLHSIDSPKLLEAIDRILAEENERARAVSARSSVGATDESSGAKPAPAFPEKISALLEVHISDDATKQGFSPDELLAFFPKIASYPRVKIRGLMGMGGLTAGPDELRRQFASLRALRDRCRARFPESTADFVELSMGMSGDFELAIEEGATIVRVGSALYPAKG